MPKKIHLTDLALRALQFSDAQVTYWDAAQPAFGIRVGKRTKTFIAIVNGGHRVKIGNFPETKLQDARKAARQLLANRPSKQSHRASTVSQALELFLDAHSKKNRRSSHIETSRLLRKYLLPQLGARRLEEVKTDALMAIIDATLNAPAVANAAFRAIRSFFNWCVARRYLKYSPIAGVPLPAKPSKRDRVLNDAELVRIYRAALQYGYPYGKIILLCIHTGLRRGEVAALKWSYITPEYITIPAELCKNGREHMLPNLISDKLGLIPRTSDFLFPSDANTPFSAWSKNKLRFEKLCGVTGWVLHDLRRTFATKMAEWQIAPPHVIERILNHSTGSMTPIARVYNRWSYLTELTDAMQRYEGRLAQLLASSLADVAPIALEKVDNRAVSQLAV